MARRYRKSRKHGKAKPSLLSMVPVAVLGASLVDGYQKGGFKVAMQQGITATTGMTPSGDFQPQYAMPFYGSLVATYAAKKIVGMSGVNRALKGLPFRL